MVDTIVGRVHRKLVVAKCKKQLGHIGENTVFGMPDTAINLQNVYIYDNCHIYEHSKFIISSGKFVMKSNSGAAQGLTVVTDEHKADVGLMWFSENSKMTGKADVIVEEDVLIGSNVTLLAGITIGRGANIGANAVVRKSIPPYAIVIGNPAKVIGFRFGVEEIIKHEQILYDEVARIDRKIIEKNYKKYYYDRLTQISDYLA